MPILKIFIRKPNSYLRRLERLILQFGYPIYLLMLRPLRTEAGCREIGTLKRAPELIDISKPLSSVAALDNPSADKGTATVVYSGSEFPQTEPEEFSADWLRSYRALKSLKFAAYIGNAFLIDFSEHIQEHISAADLIAKLTPLFEEMKAAGVDVPAIPGRVLFKTAAGSASLSFDAIQWLYARGVFLIGTDRACVNSPNNPDNEEYMRIHDIVWLVNLDLQKCEEGPYFLSALPLADVEEGTVATRAFLVCMPEG